jgi:hypothetical protein
MAVSGSDLVAKAQTQLGKPYVWAAEGPDAYDCSGLMQWTYRQFGINLPRVTYDQVKVGQPVASLAQAAPGDLVFTTWNGKVNSHVGMYMGNNRIIQASSGRVNEMTVTPSYLPHINAIRRVTGVSGGGPAGGISGGAVGGIGTALDVPGALNRIADGMSSIAGSAASVGKAADLATRIALPTTLMRIGLLGAGTGLVIAGLFFISREARQ